MTLIKKLTITFDSDGFWRINNNYQKLTNEENQTLKGCIASLCQDLEMEQEDFYFL